jgi:hypothetical protein
MYLTFEQAMQLIKPNGAKNKNYHMSRISFLINEGYLVEAKPEIYVKQGNIFMNIAVNTERLVTYQSVMKYITEREKNLKEYGKIPKPNRTVKAVFSDNTNKIFFSIDQASHFFNVSPYRITQSIKKNKPVEIPIIEERKTDLTEAEGIKNELVRFY